MKSKRHSRFRYEHGDLPADADPRNARRLFLDSLDTARTTGVKSSYSRGALLGLALAAGAGSDPAVAATLHGAADQQYQRAGRAFEAAGRLFLSVNSVRSHMDRIRDKTAARRRAELVRYAIQAGIEGVAPST